MQMFSQVFGNNGLFTEFNFGGPEGADVSVYAYVLCKQKQAKLWQKYMLCILTFNGPLTMLNQIATIQFKNTN